MSQTPNPDEDYSEVVVLPPEPVRKPRAKNPSVDNIIHSGEIPARSMVVRSTSQPALAREDPTEPVQQRRYPPIVVTRTRRFPPIVWLIAAMAPLIAAVALRYAHPATTVSPATRAAEADSLAQLAATLFDGDARAAQVRADAIASSSMLRAGIQTDAKTLQDMARDKDLVFPIAAGETLEVYQGTGATRASMLRLPADGPSITPPQPGTARLEAHGATLAVVVGALVAAERGNVGELALVAPIDLASLKAHPMGDLTGVALAGLGAPLALGTPAVPGGSAISVPITTTVAKGASLSIVATLAAAAPSGSEHLLDEAGYACAALAALFLIVFGVSLFRR